MKLLYLTADTILSLTCCYRIFVNLREWPNYSSCAVPIQIFLVVAPFTILIAILICHFLDAHQYVPHLKKCLNLFIIFIFTPFCFYLLVQGVIWQMIIRQKSPNCPTGISETPWIWAFLLFLFGMLFTQETYFIIREYWQTRRTLNNQLAGDHEIVIELEEVENNQIRLLSSDIKQLEKKDSYEENCPICLVEFNGEEKIVTLPKCRHLFHSECVANWLQNKPNCPMCRGSVRNGMMSIELQAVKKNRYRPPNAVENLE